MSRAMAATSAYAFPRAGAVPAGWLRSPSWDLTFISLSAVLVFIPYSVYQALLAAGVSDGASASAVDLIVTLFIGGPHMYATFTRTVADPGFRQHHRRILATSILIPVGVFVLGLNAFQLLLTAFMLWASIHVLHQIVFLMNCYDRRSPSAPSLADRLIDYAVVIASPYPLAMARLVDGTFSMSGVPITLPEPLRQPWLVWLTFAGFGAALVLFVAKSVREYWRGRIHWPKLLLITATVVVAFLLPLAPRLDAAFQGFNAWHSFQYLGLTWYANRLAAQRQGGHLGSPIPMPTDGWRFYAAMVVCTIGAGGVYGLLWLLRGPLGMTPEQPYYVTVLSFLLIHYYHDHVLFTQPEALIAEASG